MSYAVSRYLTLWLISASTSAGTKGSKKGELTIGGSKKVLKSWSSGGEDIQEANMRPTIK